MRTAVERDDPRLVNQLLQYDDVAGRLEDLIVAAVPAADAVPAARDAPRPRAEVAVAVRRPALAARLPLGGEPHLRLGRQGGHASVGRIGDQRGALQRLTLVAP